MKKYSINWTVLFMLILIFLMELIGFYCEEHEKESDQKDRERFEQRVQRVHSIKWENE